MYSTGSENKASSMSMDSRLTPGSPMSMDSIRAPSPTLSGSFMSDASTGPQNDLFFFPPQELSEEFHLIANFIINLLEEKRKVLPSHWSPEEFLQLIIGQEEVLDPSILAEVYSNLLECRFDSCYWELAVDYFHLLHNIVYIYTT